MKTLKQHIRQLTKEQYKELTYMCYESRKLYNCALYILKEYYRNTNKYIGYNNLYKEIKDNVHYKNLNSKCAQQIIRLVDKDYRSFFALLKRKLSGKYVGNIKEPGYKPKDSKFILIFPNDGFNIKNGLLKITKKVKLPFSYEIDGKLKQLVIISIGKYFEMNIMYEERSKVCNLNKENVLGIDLGIDNFVSCLSNSGTSLIVNGKPLKSYNQYYNKRKIIIQSELKIKNDKHRSNKLTILNINRSNYIDNYLNQVVAILVKHCVSNDIGNIVCGYNIEWKHNINKGKVFNQRFVYIPYYKFRQKLENKCKSLDIKFTFTEESYTSKCSFLDNEEICFHSIYKGKRVKRGLFRTSKNILYNADVQAAGNIIKKVFPKTNLVNGIEDAIIHPKVLNIFNL